MTTTVENTGALERRVTLSIPLTDVRQEVEKRLKLRAKTARAPGFRPGKVPMKMVASQYGYQVETEVLNDRVGQAFDRVAVENNLRVAGMPTISARTAESETPDVIAFDATFEVYPEVKIGDLSTAEVEKIVADVGDKEIDRTIEILRKQRVHYHTKGESHEHGAGDGDARSKDGDRVTVDFVGRIDETEFAGGKAEDYAFVLGEGSMLKQFEEAARGLAVGESREFELDFPEDYHGKDVAGKKASFTMTLKKIEWAHLPEVDENFARMLGIEDGSLDKMREDIRANLEREVGARVRARDKESVMEALIKLSELDLPKVLIEQDVERLVDMTRQDMVQRGMDPKNLPLPPDMFTAQAERRVRLGLILAELVKQNDLKATPEQVRKQVEDFAASYEDPQQVIRYYYGDRSRLNEVEALVLEENVVRYVQSSAKVNEKTVDFDTLMGNQTAAA